MRFLHTADWHVGKNLNGFDLLADQQAVFKQIEGIAKERQVDAVVIAGDLYDRSIPSEAAVRQLNGELVQLNLTDHFPVLAISGNHDSATRLGTGASWFAKEGLYLNTSLDDAFDPVTIGDTEFFLLPYFGIQAVRNHFGDDAIRDVNTAITRIVAAMQEHFTPGKHHVLVAHIDTDPFTAEWVPLAPVHDIHRLTGAFADLVADDDHPRDDFYDIELTDHERIPDVLNKLREHYPKIVSLHRTHAARQIDTNHARTRRQQSPTDLLADFYQQTMGIDLTDMQLKWASDALSAVNDGEEE